jgi:hypothetical protein
MICRNSRQPSNALMLAFLVLLIFLLASTAVPTLAQSGTWSRTGSMNADREDHTATLLQNGKVAGAKTVPAFSAARCYTTPLPASGPPPVA